MMASYDITGCGERYFVTCDGVQAFGPFSRRWRAEEVCDQQAKKAKEKLRPCLSCQDIFLSEGPHNRLCDPCREGDIDEDDFEAEEAA